MTRTLACLVFLVGCGASGEEGDSGDTSPAVVETYEATWDGVQQMFSDHCDSCHPSRNGIDLRSAVVSDIEDGSGAYVVPGDAEASLLWALIGTSTLNFMPQTGQLPAESVAHVSQWIDDGASLD